MNLESALQSIVDLYGLAFCRSRSFPDIFTGFLWLWNWKLLFWQAGNANQLSGTNVDSVLSNEQHSSLRRGEKKMQCQGYF